MNRRYIPFIVIGLIGLSGVLYSTTVISQQPTPPAPDAVQEAQTPRQVQSIRPEQQQTPHDQSDIFAAPSAPPSSPVLETQPDQGKTLGFDFARDPLDAKRPMPFYLDDKMHDLKVERFLNEPPDGPIKTFTLRGIKDSAPYLQDGRLLTLEDTVEFFNLVLGLQLNEQEKRDLVAFMRQL
jgi:cytochrome c peroxidase